MCHEAKTLANPPVSDRRLSRSGPVFPRAQTGAKPFVLAAADFMGGLKIVGRFDGSKWLNSWPEPAESDVPVPLLSQVPESWLGQRGAAKLDPVARRGTKMPVTIARLAADLGREARASRRSSS